MSSPLPVQVPAPDDAARPAFGRKLAEHNIAPLTRAPLAELQVNVGRLCNQACTHCHVDAGPKRTEIMAPATMRRILDWVRRHRIRHVDITGGAPELNPGFRGMVISLLAGGAEVTSRCNLTVLLEPGQEDLAGWYAANGVRLVCSLPCYSRENVDRQRGKGVFSKSIRALQTLNSLGYGDALVLDLVYNPGGPSLPPSQASLEAEYRRRLGEDFGIRFSRLFTLANLPINRFEHYLRRTGQLERYEQLLVDSFNPSTVPSLMCRHLLSVDWLGRVFDCDFNQMLDLPLDDTGSDTGGDSGGHTGGHTGHRYLWDIEPASMEGRRIAVGPHCFGCTAGAGSSCGGALT